MYKVLYECTVGSTMHGTADENSDVDTRVIYRDNIHERLSPFRGTTVHTDNETDRTYYELSHFASMLAKCNPTAMELSLSHLWKGDKGLVMDMARAALDTEKYVSQCNGMILGMVKKATPKSLHHAARVHTHLTRYVQYGIIDFYTPNYGNYPELLAIKSGAKGLDERYTRKVEVITVWDKQDLEAVEAHVVREYMEDMNHGFQSV